jgi:internalin A
MNARFAWVVLIPLLVAAASPQDEAAKKDLQAMQGSWTVLTYVAGGRPALRSDMSQMKLSVKDNVSTFVQPKKTSHGKYTLDPSKNPKWIDIELTDGPDKGKKKLGLYAFENDQLKICVAGVGAHRPTELSAGSDTTMETWERAEPKQEKKLASNSKRPRTIAEFVSVEEANADDTKPAPQVKKAADDKKPLPAAKPAADDKKPAPAPVPSPFKDKNLEAAVRATLHLPTGDLTDSNLINVYILEASDKKIANLAGLEKCKNLQSLKLTKNQISDLAPLKELTNLASLDLADNKIGEIAPLAGLTKLQYIELSNNQVAKIDALAGMAALNSLYLAGNQIVDLTPVAKLNKLWTLSAPHNHIKDLSALASLTRLSTLNLSENQIEDLAALAKFKEINLLMLDHNKVADLTPLIDLLKLDAQGEKRIGPFLMLYLAGNPLSETAKGSQLQALKSFGARIHL